MKACLKINYQALSKHQKVKFFFDKTRIEKIREELKKFEQKFSKSEIKTVRKKLYERENGKSLFTPKKIEKYLLDLKENLSKLKKYYDNDKDKCQGTRSIRD